MDKMQSARRKSGVWAVFGWITIVVLTAGLLSVQPKQVTFAQVGETNTPTQTETQTETQTPTVTLTPTVTGTPTVTQTATSTPTITGTPPTPTYTGTITPNPVITVSVSPSSARVNQTLTFTIRVRNPGTAPAKSAVLTDAFPSYIDVLSVTINQGSASKSIHSVTVNLGDLEPGDNVSITITTKVNSSLSRTATVSNIVSLTYDTNNVRTTSVTYSVIATTTLPGTGHLPVENRPDPVGLGYLLSLWFPIMMASIGVSKQSTKKTGFILLLVFILVFALLASCIAGQDEPAISMQPLQTSVPEDTPTPTLMPFMPAYRFATPEVHPEFPEYPVPSPTLLPDSGGGKESVDTSPINRIVIPDLDIDALVRFTPFEGLSWPVDGLRDDVGWLGDTSWPGLGGNTVLAGHVTVKGLGDGPFRYLEDLDEGAEVMVYTDEYVYTYNVKEQMTVNETDLGVTLPTINAQITLITCTGWDSDLSIYRFRRVVVADLVGTEQIVRQGQTGD